MAKTAEAAITDFQLPDLRQRTIAEVDRDRVQIVDARIDQQTRQRDLAPFVDKIDRLTAERSTRLSESMVGTALPTLTVWTAVASPKSSSLTSSEISKIPSLGSV